jgi:hypothetical protein
MSYTLSSNWTLGITPVCHYDWSSRIGPIGDDIWITDDISGNENHIHAPGAVAPKLAECTLAEAPTGANRCAVFTGSECLSGVIDYTNEDVQFVVIGIPDQTSDTTMPIMALVNTSVTNASQNYKALYYEKSNQAVRILSYATPTTRGFLAPSIVDSMQGILSGNEAVAFRKGSDIGTGELATITTRSGGWPQTWTLGSCDKIIIGRNDTSTGTYHFSGRILEILVFDHDLSTFEQFKLDSYIKEKYDTENKRSVNGFCYDFPGNTDSYIEIEEENNSLCLQTKKNSSNYIDTSFGMEFWTKFDSSVFEDELTPTNNNAYRVLAWGIRGGYENEIRFRVMLRTTGSRPYLYCGFGTQGNVMNSSDEVQIVPDRWHHIRMQFELEPTNAYGNGETVVYIDGVDTITQTNPVGTSYVYSGGASSSNRIFLGSFPREWPFMYWDSDWALPHKGQIADFRFWSGSPSISGMTFMQNADSETTGGASPSDLTYGTTIPILSAARQPAELPRLQGKHLPVYNKSITWNQYSLGNLQLRDSDMAALSGSRYGASFYSTHFYLNNNKFRTVDWCRDWFADGDQSSAGYQFNVSNCAIRSLSGWNDSTFAANARFTYLYLNYNLLTDVNGLSGVKNMVQMYLNYNRIKDISAFQSLTSTVTTYIDFSNNNIDTIPYGAFQYLPNLTSVKFTNNPLSSIGGFYPNNSIITLNLQSPRSDIDGNSPPLAGLDSAFHLPELKWVYLNYTTLNDTVLPPASGQKIIYIDATGSNFTDVSMLGDQIKTDPYYNVSSTTHAVYDSVLLQNNPLDVPAWNSFGASTKRLKVMNRLNLRGTGIEDLRPFDGSWNCPGRGYFHITRTDIHYCYLPEVVTNTPNSLGVLKKSYELQCLHIGENATGKGFQGTSLDELFTSTGLDNTRQEYYDKKSFHHTYVQYADNLTDLDWLTADSFAGCSYLYLSNAGALDYSSFQSVVSNLVNLKAQGVTRLSRIYLEGSLWDTKQKYGGTAYQSYCDSNPSHSYCDYIDSDYYICDGVDGTGSGLSVQAQIKKDLWDAGIKLSFTNRDTGYNPNALGNYANIYTCPI